MLRKERETKRRKKPCYNKDMGFTAGLNGEKGQNVLSIPGVLGIYI